MRLVIGIATLGTLLAVSATAHADEPSSLALAKRFVAANRGDAHREKMRVDWPEVEDETPPDRAEVVIVDGYISYRLTRLVFRGEHVDAGTVTAARSWFYNQDAGESFSATTFDVAPEEFVLAWNAARRILAASDTRVAPEPEEHEFGGSFMSSSHQSADWIRVRSSPDAAPLHCADRPSRSYDWDDVREWEGLRDKAILDLFESLRPEGDEAQGEAPVEPWAAFASAEIRAVAQGLDRDVLRRDDEILDTCLRLLGEAGEPSAETDVAAFIAACPSDEATRAAMRLRVRHHWDPSEAARMLRSMPSGTWADEDQARWLRERFRETDPQAWTAFLLEEVARSDASDDQVAAATTEIARLPSDEALPALRGLLEHTSEYVQLEAALALHARDANAEAARTVVSELALDRTIACDWRADMTNRWSRVRALQAALKWGALAEADLHAHLVFPARDDPAFLRAAFRRLAGTEHAVTPDQEQDAWRRLLDDTAPGRVLEAVRRLVAAEDVASRPAMLRALDRLKSRIADVGEDAAGARADVVARWRGHVRRLGVAPDGE